MEERFLNFGEFGWVYDFENVFNFIEEYNFFGIVDFGLVM